MIWWRTCRTLEGLVVFRGVRRARGRDGERVLRQVFACSDYWIGRAQEARPRVRASCGRREGSHQRGLPEARRDDAQTAGGRTRRGQVRLHCRRCTHLPEPLFLRQLRRLARHSHFQRFALNPLVSITRSTLWPSPVLLKIISIDVVCVSITFSSRALVIEESSFYLILLSVSVSLTASLPWTRICSRITTRAFYVLYCSRALIALEHFLMKEIALLSMSGMRGVLLHVASCCIRVARWSALLKFLLLKHLIISRLMTWRFTFHWIHFSVISVARVKSGHVQFFFRTTDFELLYFYYLVDYVSIHILKKV